MARYAHLARESVKEAAARIAASIGEDILRQRDSMDLPTLCVIQNADGDPPIELLRPI